MITPSAISEQLLITQLGITIVPLPMEHLFEIILLGCIRDIGFDLLYLIYEEEGYSENTISSLILEKNLYGIEIDKRAGDLASFALTMKARLKQKKY